MAECVCGSKLEEIKTNISLSGGELEVDAYHCPSCGEEVLTTHQLVKATNLKGGLIS